VVRGHIRLTEQRIDRIPHVRTVSSDQWRAALELRGDLDLAIAPQLRSELEQHLDAGRRVLRVDMGEVSFVDSTVLGELILASEWCRREHGTLILTSVPPRVQRLISLAGLESVLLIDTVPDEPRSRP
jgi:anti-sigma B factor antagonist